MELAGARQRICDAELEQARGIYQTQLEAEAQRKQVEAERRLREAERADSAAGKAISRLGALVSRMENELVRDQKVMSRLQAAAAEGRTLQEGAKARYESLRVLYPAARRWRSGRPMRSASRNVSSISTARHSTPTVPRSYPISPSSWPSRLTDRGQLEIFRNRIAATKDELERSRDDAARAAAIERDLARNLDPDYRLWLTARHEFLDGRMRSEADLRGAAALRTAWEQNATQLREFTKKRLDERDLQIRRVGEIESIVDGVAEILDQRREHLASIASGCEATTSSPATIWTTRRGSGPWAPDRGVRRPTWVAAARQPRAPASALVASGPSLGLGLWIRWRGRAPRPAAVEGARRVILLPCGGPGRAASSCRTLLVVALFAYARCSPATRPPSCSSPSSAPGPVSPFRAASFGPF